MDANQVSFMKTCVSTCGETCLWLVGTEAGVRRWRCWVEGACLFDCPAQSAQVEDAATEWRWLELCAGFVLRAALCSVTNCGACLADRSNVAAQGYCWRFCGRFGPHLGRIRHAPPGGCRPGEQRSPVCSGTGGSNALNALRSERKQVKRERCVGASVRSCDLSSVSLLLGECLCASVARRFSAKPQTVLFLLL